MSLGLVGQRRRNRRRLAIATAKMLLALSCILVIGWFSFRLGTERILGQLARARAEAVRLEQDVSAVEVAWAISDLNAEALAGELGDMRRRFRDEMPGGAVRQLLPMIDAKLSQGVTTERLATIIRAARNERRCDPTPATKRAAVRTSIGPTLNSSASFAEASITVTAVGTPARNSDGSPEAWFDPALPVTVRFVLLDGRTEEAAGVLPLRRSVVLDDWEHRFSVSAGRKGFVIVVDDRCAYP